MIELQKVFKNHGNTAAVVDISLSVKRGESLALLGHSGSGKTSLLRLIAGLDLPDSGNVRTHGRIGMVFQSLALWPHVTVRGQLELVLHETRWNARPMGDHMGSPLPGGNRGRLTVREQRIREMLALFGIQHLAGRRPGMLSGGEQQRVAFARALAPDPEILLLDEPFAHLDDERRSELHENLRPHLENRAVVIATHSKEDAVALSNRCLRMKEGKNEGRMKAEG